VLSEDAITVDQGLAEAHESAAPGLWARRAGEDAPAGAVLRKAGQQLRDFDVALAQAANISECEVRRPRLLFAGRHASPAARLLIGLARVVGIELLTSDVPAPGMAESADLVLVLGEVAIEFEGLSAAGGRVMARRLALRPGEDGAALRLGDVPVLLAPDRPADALGMWLALGLPLLRILADASAPGGQEQPLTRKVTSTVGVAEIALLRASEAEFEPLGAGDLPLTAIARADSWLLLPPESEGFAAGDLVRAERIAP
jgi:molybdopterin biosynthesis enzyme